MFIQEHSSLNYNNNHLGCSYIIFLANETLTLCYILCRAEAANENASVVAEKEWGAKLYTFSWPFLSYNLFEPWERACLASSLLRIFPADDLGIALMKHTRRIFLYGATCKMKMAPFECKNTLGNGRENDITRDSNTGPPALIPC